MVVSLLCPLSLHQHESSGTCAETFIKKALPNGTRAHISELKDCMLSIAKGNVRGVGPPLRTRGPVPFFVKLVRTMPPLS